ncbi:serine protease [Sporichthya sp.]|uniref:serine protease n=1 Tax=Sporichthya sp. TaxID=65475 RepID=UPI0025F8B9A2|nr:serine protease [Sporichthya sp.]
MRRSLVGALTALTLGTAGTAALAAPETAHAAEIVEGPAFGPVGAPIRPGIMTDTGGSMCTANFVFTDDKGRVYLGQAGHCAQDPTDSTEIDPVSCGYGKQQPLGTPVKLGDSGVTGKLAYSSWQTMQDRAEPAGDLCRYNDFSLIEIPAAAIGAVNPSMPLFGGPTGLNSDGTQGGDLLTGWGNSPLRQGLEPLAPKQSIAVRSEPGGRAHVIYSLTPGVPGDSGGPYLDPQGRAIGSLSEIALDPPGANIITDIARALAYAAQYGGLKGLRLVAGTEPFHGSVILDSLLASPGLPSAP